MRPENRLAFQRTVHCVRSWGSARGGLRLVRQVQKCGWREPHRQACTPCETNGGCNNVKRVLYDCALIIVYIRSCFAHSMTSSKTALLHRSILVMPIRRSSKSWIVLSAVPKQCGATSIRPSCIVSSRWSVSCSFETGFISTAYSKVMF
jgi:hypothetical protein